METSKEQENINNLMQFSFDTSSLTASNITDEQFESGICEKVQDILNKEFPESAQKRYIKKTKLGLNFACPICHDSATNPRKKRGNILFRGKTPGIYICFNGCGGMSIQKFFAKFNEQLSLTDINYMSENFSDASTNNQQIASELTSNIINKEEAYKWAVDRSYVRDVLGLKDITKDGTPRAFYYLTNRCQYGNYERFLYSEKYDQILILNLVDDRILGMQIRKIGNSTGPKYLTMTLDKMRATMLRDTTPVPESVLQLSCVFNIFNIDFTHTYSKPVLVTEGPFDAFLMPNCIALSGASKNFNMTFPFWYIFDNDDTGREHAIEKIRAGYNVFLWRNFMNEYNIPEINPYISEGNKRKWDVTDIKKYIRDNKISKQLYWSPYFSNNSLNMLYI